MGCLQSKTQDGSSKSRGGAAEESTAQTTQAHSTAQVEIALEDTHTTAESANGTKTALRSDNYDHLENFPVRDDEEEVNSGGDGGDNGGAGGGDGGDSGDAGGGGGDCGDVGDSGGGGDDGGDSGGGGGGGDGGDCGGGDD